MKRVLIAGLSFLGCLAAWSWVAIESIGGRAVTGLGPTHHFGWAWPAIWGILLIPTFFLLEFLQWTQQAWQRVYCLVLALALPALFTYGGLVKLYDPKGPMGGALQLVIFLPAIPIALAVYLKGPIPKD